MKRYDAIALIALLTLVAVLPFYGLREAGRMELAQAELRGQYVADGTLMYVENCVNCHGLDGAGVGAMPALNDPALSQVDSGQLYRTIAHSPHGSTMAAWHIKEGGVLTDHQVQGLVALIQNADWSQVSVVANENGITPPAPPPSAPQAAVDLNLLTAARSGLAPEEIDLDVQAALLGEVPAEDPHACSACHEQPEVHDDRFGLQCARCHGLAAWQPALLTRHPFELDHGGEGQNTCETCHVDAYVEQTCYGCHEDHQADEMQEFHVAEGIVEFENCADCHPTGRSGEAERLQEIQAHRDQSAAYAGLHVDIQTLETGETESATARISTVEGP